MLSEPYQPGTIQEAARLIWNLVAAPPGLQSLKTRENKSTSNRACYLYREIGRLLALLKDQPYDRQHFCECFAEYGLTFDYAGNTATLSRPARYSLEYRDAVLAALHAYAAIPPYGLRYQRSYTHGDN